MVDKSSGEEGRRKSLVRGALENARRDLVDLTRRNRLLNAAILVAPVTLSGVNGREGYLLDGCDKDVMVNFALMEKMRGDFGLTLPEIPEIERLKPSNHFEQVEAETGRQHLWQVESGSIGLGFFTFSKFIL